jgi:hypothetical protein
LHDLKKQHLGKFPIRHAARIGLFPADLAPNIDTPA